MTTTKIRTTILTLAAAVTVAIAMAPATARADFRGDGPPEMGYYHCSIEQGEPCIYEDEQNCRMPSGEEVAHGRRARFFWVWLGCFDGYLCLEDERGFKPSDPGKCVWAPAKPGPTRPGVGSPDSAIGPVGSHAEGP
jgi:hypothetical protein